LSSRRSRATSSASAWACSSADRRATASSAAYSSAS